MISSERREPRGARPSDRVARACAMFGITDLHDSLNRGPVESLRPVAAQLDRTMKRGTITVITGPSGSGKSTLLRLLEERAAARPSGMRAMLIDPSSPDSLAAPACRGRAFSTPLVDLFECSVDEAMSLLARVGLAEAWLFARRYGQLSEGQKHRAMIALAMARSLHPARAASGLHARPPLQPRAILIDEFTSSLDRLTALALARSLRRAIDHQRTALESSSTGARARTPALVLATAHEDIVEELAPDVLVRVPLMPRGAADVRVVRVERSAVERGKMEGRARAGDRLRARSGLPACDARSGSILGKLVIRAGSIGDFDLLARFHYKPHRPGVAVQVLTAHLAGAHAADEADGNPLGVLVVSMPVLNSRVRELAWPGRYCSGDRRRDARRVNAELRTISRLVVDPRVRGVGVARALVRAYLDDPLSPATEATAAMGSCCPFFASAGMTEYRLPPSGAEARFEDYLTSVEASAHEVIADSATCRRVAGLPRTGRELDRFRQGSPRRSFATSTTAAELLRRVCTLLLSPRVAYAHSEGSS